MSVARTVKVRCPTCGTEIEWKAENRHRPFCSERCRRVDLGAWANEEYRVPASASSDDLTESPPTSEGD